MSQIKTITLLITFLAVAIHTISAQELHPAERNKIAKAYANNFETSIDFTNNTPSKIKIFWIDGNGNRLFQHEVLPRQTKNVRSYLASPWLVTDERDNSLGIYYPDAQPRDVQIGNTYSGNDRRYEGDYDDDDRRTNYDTTPITICRDQPIPRGYLIIAESSLWNCPNWTATGKNTYTIQRPSRTAPTNVCSDQDIPRGFVVTGASSNWACPGWSATGKNSYTIKRPGDIEEICSISEVPPRYVLVSVGLNWACPNWSATGKNTKKIKRLN